MKSACLALTLAVLQPLAANPDPAARMPNVVGLQVEGREGNTVVSTPLPRLTWRLDSKNAKLGQTKYEVLASRDKAELLSGNGTLWNSGVVSGNLAPLIRWSGSSLRDGDVVYWKVRAYLGDAGPTAWSEVATFTVKLGSGNAPLPFPPEAKTRSTLACSNEAISRLYDGVPQALKELEDLREICLAIRGAAYQFRLVPETGRWLDAVVDAADPAGYLPAEFPPTGAYGAVGSDAPISGAFAYWWMTGDASVIVQNWSLLYRYALARQQVDPTGSGLAFGTLPEGLRPDGDSAPEALYFQASEAMTLRLLLELSRVASHSPFESRFFNERLSTLQSAFVREHLDPATNRLRYPSPSAHILALRSGLLVDQPHSEAVQAGLVELVKGLPAGQVLEKAAGFSPLLMDVLTFSGETDLAYSIASHAALEGCNRPNQIAIAEWMISRVAGIDAANPGFARVRFNPRFPAGLDSVNAVFDSWAGEISSSWQRGKDDTVTLRFTSPPGITASVSLSLPKDRMVSLNGTPFGESADALGLREQGGESLSFFLLPGSHELVVRP